MASKQIARASVVLFLVVLMPSIALIVHGSRHPTYYRPIARGEMLPPVAMADTSGQLVRLNAQRDAHLMLVGAPSLDLTAAQRDWIAQLAMRVEAAIPVQTMVITAERHPKTTAMKVCPTAGPMLVDEDRSLLQLLGSSGNEAVICIIDRAGHLVFRARVPGPAEAVTRVAQLSAAELQQIMGSARVVANRE